MAAKTFFTLFLVVALAGLVYYVDLSAPILTGYCAKYLCSAHFISGRDVDHIIVNDFYGSQPIFSKVLHFGMHQQRPGAFVSVRILGHDFWQANAYFRRGVGCSLHLTKEDEAAQPFSVVEHSRSRKLHGVPWPFGDDYESHINPKVQAVLDAYVKQNNDSFFTRQVAVVHDGKLVGEANPPDFPPTMPLLGWSMTKSVINYFIGRLVHLGKIQISDKAFPNLPSTDPRSEVTIDQLLRMSSGLKFEEVYAKHSDATRMLFIEKSAAGYASQSPLEGPPDSVWYYSSGSSNILSQKVKEAVGGTLGDYYKWTQEEFFGKLGLSSAIIEPDASGTFVGSSFMWATARDWAKFGLLYLQNGEWNGEQILPPHWTNYSSTPTPKSNHHYGAHFWLTDLKGFHPDAFFARGFQGQSICISPADNLVIVRLGLDNFASGSRKWEPEGLYEAIVQALKD